MLDALVKTGANMGHIHTAKNPSVNSTLSVKINTVQVFM